MYNGLLLHCSTISIIGYALSQRIVSCLSMFRHSSSNTVPSRHSTLQQRCRQSHRRHGHYRPSHCKPKKLALGSCCYLVNEPFNRPHPCRDHLALFITHIEWRIAPYDVAGRGYEAACFYPPSCHCQRLLPYLEAKLESWQQDALQRLV